jgi:hypothetical protein
MVILLEVDNGDIIFRKKGQIKQPMYGILVFGIQPYYIEKKE